MPLDLYTTNYVLSQHNTLGAAFAWVRKRKGRIQ